MFLLAKINSEYMNKQWHVAPWTHALGLLLTLEKKEMAPHEIYYHGNLADDVKDAFNRHASDLLDLPRGSELTSAPKSMTEKGLYVLDETNFHSYLTRLGIKPPKESTDDPSFCELYYVDEKQGKFQLNPISLKEIPLAAKALDRRKTVTLVPPFLPSDVPSDATPITKKYVQQATTDERTGVMEPKRFGALMQEISSQEGTFIFLDVDKMGKLNHKQDGYRKVNSLLKEIGTVLKTSIRQSDLICRYGGDEFALFLLGCEATDAVSVVKRIQDNLAKSLSKNKNAAVTTLSAGISQCRIAGQFVRSFREAQLALERAKKKGGHRGKIESCSIADAIQVFKEVSGNKKLPSLEKFYEVFWDKNQRAS